MGALQAERPSDVLLQVLAQSHPRIFLHEIRGQDEVAVGVVVGGAGRLCEGVEDERPDERGQIAPVQPINELLQTGRRAEGE